MQNPIKKYIRNYNRRMRVAVSRIDKASTMLNRFVKIWLALYRDCYYVRGLEVVRKTGDIHVDMTEWKEAIFWQALKDWRTQEASPIAGQEEIEWVEDILKKLEVAELPCPLEQSQQFKEVLAQNVRWKMEPIEKEQRQLQTEFLQALDRMNPEMPYYRQLDIKEWFGMLRKEAERRVSLQYLPLTYDTYKVLVNGKETPVYVPGFTPWQDAEGRPHFVVPEAKYTFESIRQLALTLLLSFPVDRLKLSFLDLGFSSELTALRNSLDEVYRKDLVLSQEELTAWTRNKSQTLRDTFAQFGNILQRNQEQGRIEHGYELCIINGPEAKGCPSDCMEQLTRLINDGTNTGIYFLWIGALPAQWNVRLFNELPISEGVSFIPYQTEKGCAALTDLLNQEVQAHQRRQEELKQDAIEQQQKQMFEEEAKDASEEFFIEIGTDTDTGKRALFRLDEEHHVHAFVLGQTGSGKSVFLHTLLNNAMLKYTPESLQFYLMDFKTGGVELNRYRHYPHVRALLVDESDPHITLEILRDITTLMQERGQKMREAGCNNLKSYNAAHPESPMPRIVLLVDECHELFKEGRHKIQTEMDDIVTRIAKQGRSQGVHIIFATQTLTGCSLPRDIIGQITDPYLLKCDAVDAQRFVDNPTPVINALQLHYVAHINKQMNEQEMFLPDFIGGQMDDYLAAIQKKSADIQVNFTPFYFTGTQKYSLVKGLDGLNYRRHPELSLGKSLEVRSKNISLRLRNDMAQNLLIVGSNEQYQGLRILLVSLFSLLHCNAQTSANARFVLFLNDDLIDTPDLEDYIYNLERYGVEICDNQRKRIDCLKELYGRIKQPDNRSVFLFVTNQDGCIELRQNVEIDICSNDGTSAGPTDEQKEESNLFFGGNLSFSATPTATSKKNVRTIWKDLLSNGPESGIYTVWQIQRLGNLFFETNGIYANEVYRHFLYIAFLRTEREVASKFSIDDVRLDELCDDSDRLRLYLFNAMSNSSITLSPYTLPTDEEIEKLLK